MSNLLKRCLPLNLYNFNSVLKFEILTFNMIKHTQEGWGGQELGISRLNF